MRVDTTRPPISTSTRLFVLLGDPVRHSLSPAMQNAAFAADARDGVYVALHCVSDRFAGLLRGIAAAGGGGNVTVPHKERAAELVECASDAVVRTGACNTFWTQDGRLHGDNTDVAGFDAAVRSLVESPAGARVLLLGAGGAARAATAALLDAGADAIEVLNRTASRATAMVDRLDPGDARLRAIDGADLHRANYDLVVNATPVGLRREDPLPLEFGSVRRIGAVLDMVYAPDGTDWVRQARARELPAADGREMLLRQGAAAFERWWTREAPLGAMRRALEDA